MHRIIKEDISKILSENLPWNNLYDKTILITGGAGMIGTWLTYTLLELNKEHGTGVKIIVLDIDNDKLNSHFSEFDDEIKNKTLVIIKHDIIEPLSRISGLCDEKIDIVFHGATKVGPRWYNKSPNLVLLTEVVGMKNVLELNHKLIIMESTSVTYGVWNDDKPVKEEDLGFIDTTKNSAAYAEGKRAAETLALTSDIDTRVARIAQSIGPYMPLSEAGAGADFINNVLNSQDIVLRSHGESKRAFTYIADVISALFFITLKGYTKTIYNVNSMNNYISVRCLADTVTFTSAEMGLRKPNVEIKLDEINKIPVPQMNGICLDTTQLENLGWKQYYSIKDIVTRTLEFYKDAQDE
jgi:nucleoside-diphosphate-sugar epimerase